MPSTDKSYSITIRPRLENFGGEAWIQALITYCGDSPCIWGREKGTGVGFNHIQGFLITTKRADNLKRSIQGLFGFEPVDRDEKRTWWKCECAKSPVDERYVTGYCQKENDFYSNLGDKTLQDGAEHYKSLEGKVKQMRWECTSINDLLPFAKKWWIDNYCDGTYEERVANVEYGYAVEEGDDPMPVVTEKYLAYPTFKWMVVRMTNAGVIPFSLGKKIGRGEEVFWKDLMENLTISELNRECCKLLR